MKCFVLKEIKKCLDKCVPFRSLTEIEASTNWTTISPVLR